MKLAISATACMGKTTLMKDFLKEWPDYKEVKNSYRDVIKEKNLALNKLGTEESQRIIRDIMIENAQSYSRKDNVIYDRCIIDNLAYTMWLNYYGKVSDDFVKESIILTHETLKLYDIIFFIPMSDKFPVDLVEHSEGTREVDEVYREEIDNIFKAIIADYRKSKGRTIFPDRECPAVIDIFGTRSERIEVIKLYVTKDGSAYGENDSLIVNPYGHNPLEENKDQNKLQKDALSEVIYE